MKITNKIMIHYRLTIIFFSLLLSLSSLAQSVEITQSFRKLEAVSVLTIYKNEFGGLENRLVDRPFPYAVIRVEMDDTMDQYAVAKAKEYLTLNLGAMFKVKEIRTEKSNQILFLVPAGISNVAIDCGDGCSPVTVFSGVKPLEDNAVYVGKVNYIPAKSVGQDSEQFQYFTFHVTPSDAMLEVQKNGNWDVWAVGPDGTSDAVLFAHGTYRYRISANRYHTEEGTFRVSDKEEEKEKTVKLTPKFGWLEIAGDAHLRGAYVIATHTATNMRQQLGIIPFDKKELDSGTYRIQIKQNKYKDFMTTVTISDGKTITLNPTLEANFAEVELNVANTGAGIYLNNERLDIGRWKGTLEYGDYTIETRMENHKSAYTKVRVARQTGVQTFTLNNPTPICGTLIVKGSPAGAAVYVDNKQVGKTPLVVNNVLIGSHKVRVEKSGYESYENTVMIQEKKDFSISYTLNNSAQVTLVVRNDASSSIYIRSLSDGTAERYLASKTWTGTLAVGQYEVRTTQAGHNDAYTRIDVKSSQSIYNVNAPVKRQGVLNVTSSPSGSTVYVDGLRKGTTPLPLTLSPGRYSVYATHSGYHNSKTQSVVVVDGGRETLDLNLRKDIVLTDNFGPHHLLEMQYGLGLSTKGYGITDHYVGLSYGWSPNRFGLNTSLNYGIFSQDFGISAGPTIRLTDMYSECNLQFMLGAGMVIRPSHNSSPLTWSVDAGLRFSFEEDSDLAWYSFSLGARYYDKTIIPTASVSLFPARLLYLAAIEEEDFPCIYTDVQSGYVFTWDEWLMGAQISYIPSHLGVGTSFMFGFDGGWDITVGPVFRLTPDYTILDLQIYQGFGYGSYSGDGFIAETGLRFGFGYDNPYWGLWSIDIGCLYGPEDVAITFGMSIPLIGLIGSCGLGAIFL